LWSRELERLSLTWWQGFINTGSALGRDMLARQGVWVLEFCETMKVADHNLLHAVQEMVMLLCTDGVPDKELLRQGLPTLMKERFKRLLPQDSEDHERLRGRLGNAKYRILTPDVRFNRRKARPKVV
jgi:hypothetical protein